VKIAFEVAAGMSRQEQRAAFVVVHVRVAHRRAVDHQRILEQVLVALTQVLELLEEVRHERDVMLVDLRELRDPVFSLAVM
jgi:sugar (pentulose or hexulose) kinase